MSDILTKRQSEILNFIIDFSEECGYQPSYREIGDHFGFKSTRAVSDHIDALRRKGYLEKDPHRARCMKITKRARLDQLSILKRSVVSVVNGIRRLSLKVSYGTLGNFSSVTDENEKSYAFDENLVQGENTFLLKSIGDSMIDAHIQDGDLIMVNPDYPVPSDGDIVVARLGDDATVKRFYREEDNLIRLQPENDNMSPIFVRPEDGEFELVGKVVGVYRQI